MSEVDGIPVDKVSGLPIGTEVDIVFLPNVQEYYNFITTGSTIFKNIFPTVESFVLYLSHLLESKHKDALVDALGAIQDEVYEYGNYPDEYDYMTEIDYHLYAKSLKNHFAVFLKEGGLSSFLS